MNRKERRLQEKRIRHIFNKCSTMINERKYIPKNCVICDVKMKSIHDTHNPHPVADFIYAKESNATNQPDRCCTSCDRNVVRLARIKMYDLEPNDPCIKEVHLADYLKDKYQIVV